MSLFNSSHHKKEEINYITLSISVGRSALAQKILTEHDYAEIYDGWGWVALYNKIK